MMSLAYRVRPDLLLVDGSTGAGKSTFLKFIRRSYASKIYVGTKFTDRPKRVSDTDWEFHFVDKIPSHLQEYTYTGVGRQYAIDIKEIENTVKYNLSYLVTCTDPNTIQLLRNKYNAIVIYLYRQLSSQEIYSLMERRQTTNHQDMEARQSEVKLTLANYAKNIGNYDYVILNTGTISDLEDQAKAIIRDCVIIKNGHDLI